MRTTPRCYVPEEPSESQDLRDFLTEVRDTLCEDVLTSADRFPDAPRLVERFSSAVDRLFDRGWDHHSHVIEVHNEVCTADLILQQTDPVCESLDYELPLKCERRFDFRACYPDEPSYWLEVKTIHPERLDAWEKYGAALEMDRFSPQARLHLEKEGLGGELYHKYFAARSGILSYTADTEQKIVDCLTEESELTFLVLYSNGFDWHLDQLEDFLHFYRFGQHFEGDPFGKMEEYYIEDRGIELFRNVDHFSFIKRTWDAVRPSAPRWSVRPVQFDPQRGFF